MLSDIRVGRDAAIDYHPLQLRPNIAFRAPSSSGGGVSVTHGTQTHQLMVENYDDVAWAVQHARYLREIDFTSYFVPIIHS